MDETRSRPDDHIAATRGELRAIEARIIVLRRDVSKLKEEFEGQVAGIDSHIKKAMSGAVTDALKPHVEGLGKLEAVHRILLEQEVRAKMNAEAKANDDAAAAKVSAEREHRNKVIVILTPILLALIGLLGAAVGSQVRGPSPPTTQTAPR